MAVFYLINYYFFQWCNKDARCKKLQLTDLLVSPVHHIMKIPLVIREIESRTDNLEEKTIITRIHEMKEHSLSKCIRVNFNIMHKKISPKAKLNIDYYVATPFSPSSVCICT